MFVNLGHIRNKQLLFNRFHVARVAEMKGGSSVEIQRVGYQAERTLSKLNPINP